MWAEHFRTELDLFESRFQGFLSQLQPKEAELRPFWQALHYACSTGGKRFRPLLALSTATALGRKSEEALPVAFAVELIHTYSLVHDDLPDMDNDDFRRGQPTVHKKFGVPAAILVGDALQAAAFQALAESQGKQLSQAIQFLAVAAGANGMVGGQMLDISLHGRGDDQVLKRIHELKTGALIRASVMCTAQILEADSTALKHLDQYATGVGFAFQLADDLEDAKYENDTSPNFVKWIGESAVRELLAKVSRESLVALSDFGPSANLLKSLVEYNQGRVASESSLF